MKRMRVIITVLVCVLGQMLVIGGTLAADWQQNGNDIYYNSGDVGIGTTSPLAKLHVDSGTIRVNGIADTGLYVGSTDDFSSVAVTDVSDTAYFGTRDNIAFMGLTYLLSPNNLNIDTDGNVGIGTTSPLAKLHVDSGTIRVNGIADTGLYVGSTDDFSSVAITDVSDTAYFGTRDNIAFMGLTYLLSPNNLNIDTDGNVGIGTTSPDYKLDVKGTIRAEEIKVESGGSDFVFEDGYDLLDLKTVESYVKEKKHLPDIPSAKEIEKEGLSVAEMMTKQMQKIEELTLYVIAQNKKIERLENELAKLKKRK